MTERRDAPSAACNCGGNHSGIVGFEGPGNGHAVTCPVRTAATVCLCPKCGGQKYVNKPPYVAGDQLTWVACNTGGYTCPVCNGRGFIYA